MDGQYIYSVPYMFQTHMHCLCGGLTLITYSIHFTINIIMFQSNLALSFHNNILNPLQIIPKLWKSAKYVQHVIRQLIHGKNVHTLYTYPHNDTVTQRIHYLIPAEMNHNQASGGYIYTGALYTKRVQMQYSKRYLTRVLMKDSEARTRLVKLQSLVISLISVADKIMGLPSSTVSQPA